MGMHGTRLAAAIVAAGLALQAAAEAFVDVGVNGTHVEADIATLPEKVTSDASGLHLGGGFRRELAQGSIGARIELDDLDGDLLLAVRAFDYRRHVSQRLALTAFAGAARLDLDTPAHGWYLGGGVQIKDLWPRWSLGLDLRLGDKLARDNVLPSDPQGGRPDNFYDLSGVTIYLSRGF
jgi:opacity protein-like surface antigen